MFKVNEVKSWAKKHGITVKKQGEGYVWFSDGENPAEPKHMNHVVTDIFNRITDGRFLEYQRQYATSKKLGFLPRED